MISVLILTKNEEQDLPGCLKSVSWSDDVHVFDSCSTDSDQRHRYGVRCQGDPAAFDNYASQRNAALHGLSFKYPWTLILDADERVPPALVEEIRGFVREAPAGTVAGRIRRRDIFMGTWLKHAQLSPFYIRLVRPERVRYEREVNEVLLVDGLIHDLREPFDHYPFSKGIEHWFDKHNRYSSLEARMVLAARRGTGSWSLRKAFFCRDFNERRFHQKALFYRMPLRPLLKWSYMVFVRRAFLDGRPGLTYAKLQFLYECMIQVKVDRADAGVGLTEHA